MKTKKVLKTLLQKIPTLDKEREDMHRKMFSSISHDLKTPLASMIGSLETYERIKEKLTSEKRDALLAVALQEAYRLDNFITNILDMAKLEGGLMKARVEPLPLDTILKNCIMQLSNPLKNSTITINESSRPLMVKGDVSILSRVIALVIDNAVKYGGEPSLIRIAYGVNELNEAFLSIHDNGAGIPSGKEKDIFAKYARFTASDRYCAGTGLGLTICQESMKLMKGSIAATNSPSGGAVFTLKLPIG